jgi:probable rRNA maturation factor
MSCSSEKDETLSIQVFYRQIRPAAGVDRRKITRLITHIYTEEGENIRPVNVVIADDNYMQELNLRYFGRNEPTDVISFNMTESDEGLQWKQGDTWGEIYISWDQVRAYAEEGNPEGIQIELYRLIIHGMLHLFDYDHEDDAERRSMRSQEEKYLSFASAL